MLSECLFQPRDSLIVVPYAAVGYDNYDRVHELSLVQIQQFIQCVLCSCPVSGAAIGVGQARPVPWIVSWHMLFDISLGLREHSFLYIRGKDYCGARKAGVQFANCVELRDGPVVLPGVIKNCSVIGGDNQRKRVQLSCPFAFAEGVIETAQPCQVLRIPMMTGGIVGV